VRRLPSPHLPFGVLGRSPDFRRLWIGQSVSLLGDQVAIFALPTLAIIVLRASSIQVGLLNTLALIATPLAGPAAGIILDNKVRRRPVMITADLVMFAAFGSIPVAAAAGTLHLPQLYAVAVVTGIAAVVFEVGYLSYLPGLITDADLSDGNLAFEISSSAARFAGPAIAGPLIQILGAPAAMAANSLSFVASIIGLGRVGYQEPPPAARRLRRQDLWEGFSLVFRHGLLRPLTLAAATRNTGATMARTVLLLYAYRALNLSPGTVGLILAAAAVMSLVGAVATRVIVRRLRLGRALSLVIGMEGVAWLLSPVALLGRPALALAVIAALAAPWLPIWNAQVTTLRQVVTAPDKQGRVHSAARSVNGSVSPLGALLGGLVAAACTDILGIRAGLAAAMSISGAIAATAALWVLLSEVRTLAAMPQAVRQPTSP
jgi:MFS family permease